MTQDSASRKQGRVYRVVSRLTDVVALQLYTLPAVYMICINAGNGTPNKSCLVNHWCHLCDTSRLLNVTLWQQVNRIWLPVVLEFNNTGINQLAHLTESKL